MSKEDSTRNIQPVISQEDDIFVIPASQEESQDVHGDSHPQTRLVRRLESRQLEVEPDTTPVTAQSVFTISSEEDFVLNTQDREFIVASSPVRGLATRATGLHHLRSPGAAAIERTTGSEVRGQDVALEEILGRDREDEKETVVGSETEGDSSGLRSRSRGEDTEELLPHESGEELQSDSSLFQGQPRTRSTAAHLSSSAESEASTAIVGQEWKPRSPGAARATHAAMNVQGGIYDRRSSDSSISSSGTTPYPQSTASSVPSTGSISQMSGSSSSGKSFDSKSSFEHATERMSSQISDAAYSQQATTARTPDLKKKRVSDQSSTSTSSGERDGRLRGKTADQQHLFGDPSERSSSLPSASSRRAFQSLQPSQEVLQPIDISLVDIIPGTPERFSRSLPAPIPNSPTDLSLRYRTSSSASLTVVQETDAEASQEVHMHDFQHQMMTEALAAQGHTESGPQERVFSQELFQTPASVAQTDEPQPKRLKPSGHDSPSTKLSPSPVPSSMSSQHGTQLSLDWPSPFKPPPVQQQEATETDSQKRERRAPYFVKPPMPVQALTSKQLTERFGMAPTSTSTAARSEQPIVQLPGLDESEGEPAGEAEGVAVGEKGGSEEMEVAGKEMAGGEGEEVKESQMELSFVLKLSLTQGDVLQSQMQEQNDQPVPIGDMDTEQYTPMTTTPSQSIITLAKSTETAELEQPEPTAEKLSSDKQQQSVDEREDTVAASGQVEQQEVGFQLSLPRDGDLLRPTTTPVLPSGIHATSAVSVVTSSASLATTVTSSSTAASGYSLQFSSSPVRQAPIVLPRAASPTHTTMEADKSAQSARTAATVSTADDGNTAQGEGQVTAKKQKQLLQPDVFGAGSGDSVESSKQNLRAVKKVRIVKKVLTEYIEEKLIAEDGTVVSTEKSERTRDLSSSENEEPLDVEVVEVLRAERTEQVVQQVKGKKRKRLLTRPEIAAKSSSSTSGDTASAKPPPPRRQRPSESPMQPSRAATKKLVVTLSPARRSPRRARVNSRNVVVGARVFGRWFDRLYYPGEVLDILPRGRYTVQFDDGDQCEIAASDVIILDVLPIGSSVSVLYDPLEYGEAVVEGHCTIKGEPGYVVRRKGKLERYPRSRVILTTAQASVLFMSSSTSPARGSRDKDSDSSPPGHGAAVTTAREEAQASHSPVIAGPSGKDERLGTKRQTREGSGATPPTRKRKSMRQSPNVTPDRTARGERRSLLKQPIFQGLVFVVTRGDQQKGSNRKADKSFNKEQLVEQITDRNGQVIDDLTDPNIGDMSRCLVIANSPCRTSKYLQALACGVPCVSYMFISDSVKQGRFLSYQEYLLPAGFSYELNRDIECVNKRKRTASKILANEKIMVDGDSEFKENWTKILTMCGAVMRHKLPSNTAVLLNDDEEDQESCWCDCVISDGQPTASLLRRASFLDIPVLSVNWPIQCLINRKKMDFLGDERYRYDYRES